jgi:hypothetical protein
MPEVVKAEIDASWDQVYRDGTWTLDRPGGLSLN